MWPMALLSVVALASAARYMVHPERFSLSFVAAMWVTLLVTVAHATLTDVAAVLAHAEDPTRAPDALLARILMVGLKESTRPGVFGGIFLTLVPLFVAVGIYRAWSAQR